MIKPMTGAATLAGQVCVVLGGAGGIGSAVVDGYLQAGARVLAADRSAERLAALTARTGDRLMGDRLVAMQVDATTWADNKAMITRAVAEFGGVDVLTSCVGAFDGGTRLVGFGGDQLVAAAAESFAVNITSLLLAIRAAADQLVAHQGRVVATASFASTEPSGGGALYTAAKHAVVGVVRQLAYELAPAVRVNCVAPGVADTMITGLSTLHHEPRAAVLNGTEAALPLRRVPTAADYVPLYTLLASPTDSTTMTGALITADSGLAVRGLAAR